jgi:CRP/FNR family cyclic AMP-dependent transcriptional regulator
MQDELPSLFDGLSPMDVQDALQRFHVVEVGAGTTLIEEGEVDPTVCVVQSGELVARKGSTAVGRILPGDLLGEMALFTGGPRKASVQAIIPCRLLALDAESYDWLRRSKHPVAYALEDRALSNLTDRLRKVGDRIASLAKGSPVESVVPGRGFFDRMAEVFGAGGVFEAGVDASALAGSRLFAGVKPDVLAEVARCFRPLGVRRGHFLCREGESGDEMYLIASGQVEVLVATAKDRVEPVAVLGAGEAFGMCSLVQPGQPRMASCLAKEKVTVLQMDRLAWAETANRGDLVGSVLRVAMIRALSDQLDYANAQLARLDVEHQNWTLLAKANAGFEAHGAFLKDEELPDYLRGVDNSW